MSFSKFTAAFILIAMFFGVPAFAQGTPSAKTGNFVQQASIGNQFEILSSQLAIKQATIPEVRDFAQMMIADHTKIGDALKNTLASNGLGLAPANTLDKKHQKLLGSLKSAAPGNFDNFYIQTQTDAHDEAVSLFKNYAQNGDDTSLRKFASDTLPVIVQHQQSIHALKQPLVSNQNHTTLDR